MPGPSRYVLTWSQVQQYELSLCGQPERWFHRGDEPAWQSWLDEQTAFAFVGQAGRLSVLKEARSRGAGYWYAYRTQAQHTHKRYLGPTARVTFARLEAVAEELSNRLPSAPLQPSYEEQASSSMHTAAARRAKPRPDTSSQQEQRLLLLSSKLSRPHLSAPLVERSRLLRELEAIHTHPLTLVSASAGSGKTTLLSTWAALSSRPRERLETMAEAEHSGANVAIAWLSLDALDNDPIRFWASIMAALRSCLPKIGQRAFAMLHSSKAPLLSTILMTLLQELLEEKADIILILDDYHVISDQGIVDSMHFLLEHVPANLHLVLATRTDPELPLSRLRVRGQVLEIRDRDLQFTQQEAMNFLIQGMGLPLSEAEVALLLQRTEGWIAGLQLAALSMSRRKDLSAFVQGFSGSHSYLLDYVQEDILARLPTALQHFLLSSAILNKLSADLCQAVTETATLQESVELLSRAERANLFLVPLDEQRHWYRLHELFREALLARLSATQPESIPLLHQRAARWYEAQGRLDEAIAHALEAHDHLYAVRLLERFITPQSWRNEYHMLRRWLERLPQEVLRARPELSLTYVDAVVLTSRRGPHLLSLVEAPLQRAQQWYQEAGDQAGLGTVLSRHAALLSLQGDFASAFAMARQALTLLSEQDQQWRGHCLSLVGLAEVLAGRLGSARMPLLQGLALLETAGSLPGTLLALTLLGEVYMGFGELQQAARYLHRTLASVEQQQELIQLQLRSLHTGSRENYYEHLALYSLAALAYEWNRLDEAEQYLQQALSEGPSVWMHILTPGLLLPVRLWFASGKVQQAQAFLDELDRRAHRSEVHREIQLCRAWLALAMGEVAGAEQWAASYAQEDEPLALARREAETFLLARLWLKKGQPKAALDLLERWKQQASFQERKHSELQMLVIQALAQAAGGWHEQARRTLLEAVGKARREGYQRLFLEEGEAMADLLKALLPDLQEQPQASYVRTLLHAFTNASVNQQASAAKDSPTLLERLTPQEQRVLRLLAQGASNQEIAGQLVIQYSTAKKHVANLLSKLGAKNRTQAVVRARAYALQEQERDALSMS